MLYRLYIEESNKQFEWRFIKFLNFFANPKSLFSAKTFETLET